MTKSKGIRAPRGMSDDDRFDRMWREDETTGCRLWTGSVTKYGHGLFNARQSNGKFKTVIAQRYAYERRHGGIPAGKIVCHRCNVHGCVNDDHLYAGTDATNCADARAAGTHISVRPDLHRGEGNGHAKLTEADVAKIRQQYVPGITKQSDLALRYGVGPSTISGIVLGKVWAHVG